MTYKELYESAIDKLEKSKITLGEFEKVIEPLNAEIDTDSDTISRQAAISAICSACGKIDCDKMDKCEKLQLPPANTSEIPNSSDTISRAKAIDEIKEIYEWHDNVTKERIIEHFKQLPPAQPAPSQVAADIARIVENGKDMRVIEAAQPTPDQNGDLWITVPDIDKVTRIYVQDGKSKFCRIFYEEQEQPEPYVGHWVNGRCDKCNEHAPFWAMASTYHESNFCPNCGADMREEKEK